MSLSEAALVSVRFQSRDCERLFVIGVLCVHMKIVETVPLGSRVGSSLLPTSGSNRIVLKDGVIARVDDPSWHPSLPAWLPLKGYAYRCRQNIYVFVPKDDVLPR